jgi:glycosyltransferase involved in cell wall biosynthesis
MQIGVDLAQFVREPYGSGIQRVLQYLARRWPDDVPVDFVVPIGDSFGLLDSQQAYELVSCAFESDPRERIAELLAGFRPRRVALGTLISLFDRWLLPEVSYDQQVLSRFELFQRVMPAVMIGYDALPMTHPENYRFAPGSAGRVSEYFRLLAGADSVVCISDFARDSILGRLRRDPALPISVAHPGGDHVDIRPAGPKRHTLVRLGTMEARKRPVEILSAFEHAVDRGLDAELLFIGSPSPSDLRINDAVDAAIAAGRPVRWIKDASDAQVHDLVHASSAFLSIGIEGYGIPVLEAIRLGTPVLYSGIQPAAELMRGHGAAPIDSERLAAEFAEYRVKIEAARVDPLAVPTWEDFVAQVVHATVAA